jgi:hypothetical protein
MAIAVSADTLCYSIDRHSSNLTTISQSTNLPIYQCWMS